MPRHHAFLAAILWLSLAMQVSSAQAGEALSRRLPPLPEPVTSFAAVTHEGWLYACGGHKGERHEYDRDHVSGAFHRLNLAEGKAWEQLPSAPPAQGVPLAAHRGYLYRTGGMAARNAPGEKQDLFSTASVLRYDIAGGKWEEIQPLPEPRSSHDAVVVNGRLYLGGGWNMLGGTNKPAWLGTALSLDLERPGAEWAPIPQPFQRRTLALAACGSQIYFIGGMDSDSSPTLAVEIYDTATGQWSKGPELPAGKHRGFSCSAIAQAGEIYASAFQGDLLRLAADGASWQVAGRLAHPRLAHRLVTAGASQVIALGGEDGEQKRPDLELLTPASTPAKSAERAALR